MNLYDDKSGNAKRNAQLNLEGRTHYVDDDTLRFHHSRILRASTLCSGLLFGIIESCSMDMNNTCRGFRPVVFDLFGNVVDGIKLEDCVSTHKAAEREMWAHVKCIDPVALNLAALRRAKQSQTEEWARMEREITGKRAKAAA